jgi:hypothetical protein
MAGLGRPDDVSGHSFVVQIAAASRLIIGRSEAGYQYLNRSFLSRFSSGDYERQSIRVTLSEHLGTINADHLPRVHALVESGKARGKTVLKQFASE